jgi:quinol monooxygenase YgiN
VYGYIGSMKAKTGHGDDIVSILLSSVDKLREAGCHLYVVSSAQANDDTIWVSEVWESRNITTRRSSSPRQSCYRQGHADAYGRVHKSRAHGPGRPGCVARQAVSQHETAGSGFCR